MNVKQGLSRIVWLLTAGLGMAVVSTGAASDEGQAAAGVSPGDGPNPSWLGHQ